MRDPRSTATHRPAGRLLRWVLVVTVGEAIGFLVPAVVGAAVTAAAWAPLPTLIAMVLAGSVEGAVLGAAQSDCLHRWGVLPLRRRWIAATSLGAAVAWSLGMLPVMVGGLNRTIGTVVLVGIGGLILLSSLPLAQYFVLHDHVKRALLWIPINVVAWLLGISWTLVPSPWVDQSTPPGILILIYGIAGLCMAATVALITGVGLTRLLLPPLEINGQARVGSHGSAASVSVRSQDMSAANIAAGGERPAHSTLPLRRTIVVVQTLVSLGGLAGSIQLLAGAATPPVSALSPLGLSSWRLPAAWLFLSVAVPSGLAAWLAWRRSVWTAPAVLLASTLLAIELLVQLPFLGFSTLQLIFGAVAIGMAIVGLLARRAGWWPPGRRAIPSPNALAQPLGSGAHQRP
jgi:hypothetical protein